MQKSLVSAFYCVTDGKLSTKTAFSTCTRPIFSTVSLNGFLCASYFCSTLDGPCIDRDYAITGNFCLVSIGFGKIISTENSDFFLKKFFLVFF